MLNVISKYLHNYLPIQKNPSETTSQLKPVLSIDGGGIRSIIPLTYLSKFEKETGAKTAELFDLFAGASSGALLAVTLNIPDPAHPGQPKYSAQYLGDNFQDIAGKIFQKTLWDKILFGKELVYSEYHDDGLVEVVEEYTGNTLFKDSLKEVIVPSLDLYNNEVVLFSAMESRRDPAVSRLLSGDVINAAVRAPTYLDSFSYTYKGKQRWFVDGGLFLNNPSAESSMSAEGTWGNSQDIYLVSLGTGQSSYTTPKEPPRGLASWAPIILDRIFDANVNIADLEMSKLFQERGQEQNYNRFQLNIPNVPLDGVSYIDQLRRLAEDDIKNKRPRQIQQVCDQLAKIAGKETKKAPVEVY